MPYAYSTFTLPCGITAARADGIGVITLEDAQGLMGTITPGGQYHGMPLLLDNRQTAKMEPEARNLFGRGGAKPNPDDPWVAVVAPNPLLRVTVRFVLRTAKATKFELFASEQEAIAWLDQRTREDAERKKRPNRSGC